MKLDIEGTVRMSKRIKEGKTVNVEDHSYRIDKGLLVDIYNVMNGSESISEIFDVFIKWKDNLCKWDLLQDFENDNDRHYEDIEELEDYTMMAFFKNIYNTDTYEKGHKYFMKFRDFAWPLGGWNKV